jgi:hypothetical protein
MKELLLRGQRLFISAFHRSMTDTAPPSFFTPIDLPFPPAERIGARVEFYRSPHQGINGLNVIFIARRPERDEIDRVLRECTALAAAHDGSLDIFVDAQFLPTATTDPDRYETLEPYGSSHFLCYDAQARAIGLRRNGRRGLVAEPVDVDAVDEDDGDDIDEATEDMMGAVADYVWYGFHSIDDINRFIDEDAASGEGFDVGEVKAHAAQALAAKRAAEAQWPPITDNDKLDRAFARLHEQGICALQYAGNTQQDGLVSVADTLDEAGDDADRYTGYCFFHSQDIDSALEGEGLRLAFGCIGSDEPEDVVRVGRRICDVLRAEGFEVEWDGTATKRIKVPELRWQRRTPA